MRLNKLIKKSKLVVLTLLLLTSTGCASKLVVYPIQQTDFYVTDKGDICMSKFYFNEVLKAKLKAK